MTKRFFTLLFAFATIVSAVNAQVEFNTENFPDPNFRKHLINSIFELRDYHGYGQPIREGDIIPEYVLEETHDIYAAYGSYYLLGDDEIIPRVTSLKGIEFFPELTLLYCDGNLLTELDLSNNTKLSMLICHGNPLTSLNISGNTKLTELFIRETFSLSPSLSINASGCTALTEIEIDDWGLSYGVASQLSVDISDCTALTKFMCQRSRLTSLNVSGCSALKELRCCQNQLSELDVSGCTALKKLNCSWNQLDFLNVSSCIALTVLNCTNNKLTSLDVSNNTELKELGCGWNNLNELDVSNNTELMALCCWSNQLTELDVSKNTVLETLQCDNNQLSSLDVSKNLILTIFHCCENQLTSLDVSKNTKLNSLYCFDNQIKGKSMDTLVLGLPKASIGKYTFYVIDTKNEDEGNVCTKAQVAKAKEKGWTAYDGYGAELWVDVTGMYCRYHTKNHEYDWLEYEGSDEAILLDEENFPDDNFRNAIAKELGLSEGSEINEGLIVATIKLDVSDGKITELSGIEYFTALTTIYCQINQISDKAMTSLIGALPDLSGNEAKGLMLTEETNSRKGALYALDFTAEEEQNVCTAEHVAAANAKGWTVYCKTTNGWQEYTGEVPTGIGASLNDNGKMTNDSYYSIDGKKLSGEPTKKGLYIHKGKKVVK